jgi:beta-N-acetylhexosaminidase
MTAGACIFGCTGPGLSADERAFFADADPLGFILFARNITDGPEQVRRLTDALRDSVGRDAPVLIDQEGGRVQRMGPPWWRGWLPPLAQMAAVGPEHAARSMYLRYRLIAEELRDVGIDVNCAPTLDLAGPDTHRFLRNRCLGGDPAVVLGAARAAAQGLLAGGVLPVIKHMPGHGRARADSHKDLPRVTATLEALQRSDFAPFKGLADLPMGMTAHILYEAIDAARPGTCAPAVIAVIREAIGFDGLLMTDDITMGALSAPPADNARAALGAGCDVILHCNGEMAEMHSVAAVSGRLTPAAARRADAALARRDEAQASDAGALAAEFDALMRQMGAAHG